ncbi:MAG: alpha/beta fold hydrolase [Burkholderiales bacterium]
MQTRFLDIEGTSTRCLSAGPRDAPGLLLLHGLSLTSEVWIGNIDALAENHYVVALDMLGHGFTRPPEGVPATLKNKIEHLEAAIRVLDLASVTISGSSYGALVAANVVLRGRCEVRRLVINGSGSAFNTEAQLAEFVRRIVSNYRPGLGALSPQEWRQRMAYTVYDPTSVPCELAAVLPLCYAQQWATRCWDEAVTEMSDPVRFRPFRILDRLESLRVPTLVVWGRDDKGGILESAEKAVARMPNANLVVFDRCAHLPMLEHPARYNEVLAHFLRDRMGAETR